MTCTLLVTAPIMIVGGLFFAIREDGPLSLILVVAIPACWSSASGSSSSGCSRSSARCRTASTG